MRLSKWVLSCVSTAGFPPISLPANSTAPNRSLKLPSIYGRYSTQMSQSGSLTSAIVLLLFFSLLLAIAAQELKKWLGVPVAPTLLTFGVLLRVAGEYIPQLDSSVQLLDNLDPSLVMLAIMPALIFEASLGIEWYTFKQEIGQIIPMATTVVVGSTFLTACAILHIFEYPFSWAQAVLFGVILNATDHVTVSSQLKEVFASKRLETLISGETLINDATILVIFTVMVDNITGDSEWQSSIFQFFRLTFGGLILGMLFAFALGFFLRRMINDELQEISITFVSAYLLFFVAEGTSVMVSGGLSTVTLGLYMTAYGKTLISPNCEQLLHGFWRLIGSNIESFVFIMAGMLLGMHFIKETFVTWSDVGFMFGLFGLLYLIRGLVVLIHFPVLRRLGYGFSCKEAILVVVSGSKGAIATALALMVYNNHNISPEFRSILLFFTVSISALTIIVGSFLIKATVKILGLETLNETQERMLIGVTTGILRQSNQKIDQMKREQQFKLTNWEKVLSHAGPENLMKQVLQTTFRGKELMAKNPTASSQLILNKYYAEMEHNEQSLVFETRRRFFTTLKGIYWHEFTQGHCLGDSVLVLMNSASRSADQEGAEMNDWELIKAEIYSPSLIRLYVALSKVPLVGRWFRSLLYDRMTLAYDCCNTFIKAHKDAEELIDEMEIDIEPVLFQRVMREAEMNVELCQVFIREEFTEGYPEIISEVQSMIASHSLLLGQRNLISQIYQQGVIQELEFDYLVKAIDSNLKTVKFQGKPRIPDKRDVLQNRFPKATKEQIELLCSNELTKQYHTDHFLFKEGEQNQGAFLIMNGRVKEFSGWVDQELRIGNIVGVQHLLTHYRSQPYKSSAQALGLVSATRLPSELVKDSAFSRDLFLQASEEIILLNKSKLGLAGLHEKYVYPVAKDSKIVELKRGDAIQLRSGGFLFDGDLLQATGVAYLAPSSEKLEAKTDCILLVFPDQLGNLIREHDSVERAFRTFAVESKLRLVAGSSNAASLGFGIKMLSSKMAKDKED